MSVARRLVVTVCPRERGSVVLPLERGGRAARLDAAGVLEELRALVARRGLADRVDVRDGCAGAVARSARNAASSTRSGNEYSQMLRTISSLNENTAQTA